MALTTVLNNGFETKTLMNNGFETKTLMNNGSETKTSMNNGFEQRKDPVDLFWLVCGTSFVFCLYKESKDLRQGPPLNFQITFSTHRNIELALTIQHLSIVL